MKPTLKKSGLEKAAGGVIAFGAVLLVPAIWSASRYSPEPVATPTTVPTFVEASPEPTIAAIPVATPQMVQAAPSAESLEEAFPVREPKSAKTTAQQSRSQSSRPRTSQSSKPRTERVAREPEQSSQVWVNTKSKDHVYHLPGMRWYGKTKAGYFTSEDQAKKDGYRAAER